MARNLILLPGELRGKWDTVACNCLTPVSDSCQHGISQVTNRRNGHGGGKESVLLLEKDRETEFCLLSFWYVERDVGTHSAKLTVSQRSLIFSQTTHMNNQVFLCASKPPIPNMIKPRISLCKHPHCSSYLLKMMTWVAGFVVIQFYQSPKIRARSSALWPEWWCLNWRTANTTDFTRLFHVYAKHNQLYVQHWGHTCKS